MAKGYIDTAGAVIIPFQYRVAFSFNEGLAKVSKQGGYGFINTKGSEVISVSKHLPVRLLTELHLFAVKESCGVLLTKPAKGY